MSVPQVVVTEGGFINGDAKDQNLPTQTWNFAASGAYSGEINYLRNGVIYTNYQFQPNGNGYLYFTLKDCYTGGVATSIVVALYDMTQDEVVTTYTSAKMFPLSTMDETEKLTEAMRFKNLDINHLYALRITNGNEYSNQLNSPIYGNILVSNENNIQ